VESPHDVFGATMNEHLIVQDIGSVLGFLRCKNVNIDYNNIYSAGG